MKKLITLITLFVVLTTNSVYAQACMPHTDDEYKEMITGTWGFYPTHKKDNLLGTITFESNGTFDAHNPTYSQADVIGTWSVNQGKFTMHVTQSKWPSDDSAGTLVCVTFNTLTIQWAEDDTQTLYRR